MVVLNEKIMEEIEKHKCSEKIKEFLKEVLVLELNHSSEDRWRYSEVYSNLVRKMVE